MCCSDRFCAECGALLPLSEVRNELPDGERHAVEASKWFI
ncbi:unnamed protein product [Chondrus crispus]|uniref:Uncharacterized protein n=1 Tax=Chondrus crispus TaxID=2769 RepID=R7Q553_CHOCR|nr:unnamed protein product [Chondrus crispus]CDF33687.1 unnamed protein product [Chondrus crispus]|eukprot:XP_005713506.1 unnamed protein product [Chondrus crispus]